LKEIWFKIKTALMHFFKLIRNFLFWILIFVENNQIFSNRRTYQYQHLYWHIRNYRKNYWYNFSPWVRTYINVHLSTYFPRFTIWKLVRTSYKLHGIDLKKKVVKISHLLVHLSTCVPIFPRLHSQKISWRNRNY